MCTDCVCRYELDSFLILLIHFKLVSTESRNLDSLISTTQRELDTLCEGIFQVKELEVARQENFKSFVETSKAGKFLDIRHRLQTELTRVLE